MTVNFDAKLQTRAVRATDTNAARPFSLRVFATAEDRAKG